MVRPAHKLAYKQLDPYYQDDNDKKLFERRLEKASINLKSSTHWSWLQKKMTTMFGYRSTPNIPIIDTIYCLALGSPTNRDSVNQLALVKCIVEETGCKDVWIVEPNLSPSDEEWLRAEKMKVLKPTRVPETLDSLTGCNIECLALDSVSYLQEALANSNDRNIFVFAPHCPMLITIGLGLLTIKTDKILLYVNDMTLYSNSVTIGPHDNVVRPLLKQLTDKLASFLSPLHHRDDEFYNAFQSLALYHRNGADSP